MRYVSLLPPPLGAYLGYHIQIVPTMEFRFPTSPCTSRFPGRGAPLFTPCAQLHKKRKAEGKKGKTNGRAVRGCAGAPVQDTHLGKHVGGAARRAGRREPDQDMLAYNRSSLSQRSPLPIVRHRQARRLAVSHTTGCPGIFPTSKNITGALRAHQGLAHHACSQIALRFCRGRRGCPYGQDALGGQGSSTVLLAGAAAARRRFRAAMRQRLSCSNPTPAWARQAAS